MTDSHIGAITRLRKNAPLSETMVRGTVAGIVYEKEAPRNTRKIITTALSLEVLTSFNPYRSLCVYVSNCFLLMKAIYAT